MKEEQAIPPVAIQLGVDENHSGIGISKDELIKKVNELIVKDFEKLINILYRIDVSEKKINTLLQQFPQQDAAVIITELMIEREVEKIAARQKFTNSSSDFTEEEKW